MWFVRSASLPRRPRFLVAVDPRHTHAKPARLDDRLLRTARTLAARLDGHVGVVHAYESPLSSAPGTLIEPVRLPLSAQHAREFVAATTRMVSRLAARHDVDAADCLLEEGPARDVIPAIARRRGTDVLVMGAVSRSMLMRPVIGSTAESVIDHVDCDVLVVKPAGYRTPVQRTQLRV
jgi:universal stress protein E